ncbi:MAG: Trm112 family protein [Phycisphaeraceae bacterium]
MPQTEATKLDAELLAMLVCPVTRSPLRQEGDELVGETGGLRFPIRDGIPVLLADEATLPKGFDSLEKFKEHFAS